MGIYEHGNETLYSIRDRDFIFFKENAAAWGYLAEGKAT
jgi:hypothetical protein